MELQMENNKYIILIADDSEIDVSLLQEGIQNEDRVLIGVYSGQAVLDYVKNNTPDLIFLDVMMTDMNGYEVCEKLKQNSRTKHIPIIFLTSLTAQDDIAKGLELGAVDYIIKPYNLTEINARIKNRLALQKGHEHSLELLKGFANSVSDLVILMDGNGKILELFGNYQKYFPQYMTKPAEQLINDVLPESLNKQFAIALENLNATKEAFEFETEVITNGFKYVLQVTMSIVKYQHHHQEIISVKVLDVTNRRTAEQKMDLTYEYQKRSRFFNGILTGGYTEEQQKQLLSTYGIESRKPMVCYVISTASLSSSFLGVPEIRASIGEWLIEKGYGWVWNSNFGIGLLMQYPGSLNEFEKSVLLMKENLEMRFPDISIRIGIASTEQANLDFKRLYYDALGALMTAIDQNEGFFIAKYPENMLYELIVHALEHMNIDRFIEQVLGKVKQHDLRNGSELLNTLEQLINVPSVKVAAANLFIHPNTVLWRKQKIEDILAESLDDINVRTQINLAFKFVHIRSFTQRNGAPFLEGTQDYSV